MWVNSIPTRLLIIKQVKIPQP